MTIGRTPPERLHRDPFTNVVWRTTLVFTAVAAAWVLTTEYLLVKMVTDRRLLMELEVLNGFVFITVAATLIFSMLRVQLGRLAVAAAARRQAEAETRAADLQLRAALEAGDVGAWEWDLRTNLVKWSGIHEQLWGMKPGSFRGTVAEFEDRLHPEDRAHVRAEMERLVSKPEPFAYEYRVIWPDGSIHWVAGHGEPICDETGKVVLLMGALREVTEQKKQEAILRESEARFRGYFELPLHGIATTSPEKGWMMVNDRLCQMLGFSREELMRLTWAELTHPDDLPVDLAQFDRVMAGEIERYDLEKRFIRKDGEAIWVALAVCAVRKTDGRVEYFVAFVEDISVRKAAEEKLVRSERLLRESQETARIGSYINDIAAGRWEGSPMMNEIFGFEESFDHTLADWHTLLHPDDRQMAMDHYNDVITNRKPFRLDYRIIRPNDGQLRWLAAYGGFEYDADGQPVRLLGCIQDITDRKQAEEAIREREERFRQLAEHVEAVFWVANLDMTEILYVNPAYETVWGRTCESLYRSPKEWLEAIHPEDRQRMIELALNGRANGEYDEVYRVVRPDGKTRWVHDRAFPVRDEKGELFRIVGTAHDITEQKEAALALANQQRFLEDLIENSAMQIYVKDRDGSYLMVNKKFEEVSNRTRRETLAHTDLDVFPGRDGERFRHNDRTVMKLGKAVTMEEVLTSPEGTRSFISVKFPTRNAAGEITGICGMTTEVTETKDLAAQLRQSEEHFRVLFEQASEGIIITDAHGHFQEVNRAARTMLGYSEDEATKLSLADVLQPSELPRLDAEIARLFGGEVTAMSWIFRRKDGSAFPVEMSAKQLPTGQMQGFFRDVSDRVAAEKRQLDLLRTLRTVSEANSLIVRATSEEQLLQDFCDRMVQQTGHRLIWIGFVDGLTKQVRVAAKAGEAAAYLDGIEITADDGPNGRGPTGTSIRNGQTVVCRCFAKDPGFKQWLDRAERAGLRSSISVPLRLDGLVVGAFTLYSETEDRFDEEESLLLGELADDLSFAISVLRRERWLRIINHAVEHSPATVVITDTDGNIQYVNPKFTQLTGYTLEEAIGKNPRILKSGESSPEDYEKLWRTIKAGGEWHGEFRNVKKNGELYWENAWISGVPDDRGEITRFIAIKEDITAKKEAERLVQEQLARTELLNSITRAIGARTDLGTILLIVACNLEQHLPVEFSAICLADGDGKTLTVSALGPQSEELATSAGLDEGTRLTIVTKGLEQTLQNGLVHKPDLSKATGPFGTALARAGLGSAVLAPLAMKEHVFGVLIAARLQVNGFSDEDCKFLRQLGEQVALATHQARLTLDLRAANDELIASQEAALQQERLRALGQMASGVAHDINNSISPILIYSDLLLQTEPDLKEESKEFLKTIQCATQDVAGTVSRLREFYRKREPKNELFPVQLNRLAKEVMNITRARWVDIPQERGIVMEMRMELASNLPDIEGIEGEIREALVNLVFNAVDAMPHGGIITFKTGISDAPARIFIEVTDSGAGMDEQTRRRCIEPFFTTKGERGTGLGLAMVCGVVQRHEGELTIESEPGKGTTIRFRFPLPKNTALAPSTRRAIVTVPPLKILVVDDDKLITTALQVGLRIDAHAVSVANGGKTGIDLFNEEQAKGEPFQLVITDLGMPKVDGRAVADAVKAASPETRVILLTGWGQRLIDEGDKPASVDQILSKPPKLAEIRGAIAGLFKSAQN